MITQLYFSGKSLLDPGLNCNQWYGHTGRKFPFTPGKGLPLANPSSTPARGHQQSSNITRTEHVHRSVFMLCSCYVYAMFMI